MKKLLVVCLSGLLMLSGCSTNGSSQIKVEQTVCEITMNGVNLKVTLDHEGDNVTKQVVQNLVTLADVQGQSVDKKTFEATAEAAKGALDGIEGLSYEYESTDTTFGETTTIDYKVVSFEKLVEIGLIAEGQTDLKKLSLDAVKKEYEAIGVTCK